MSVTNLWMKASSDNFIRYRYFISFIRLNKKLGNILVFTAGFKPARTHPWEPTLLRLSSERLAPTRHDSILSGTRLKAAGRHVPTPVPRNDVGRKSSSIRLVF